MKTFCILLSLVFSIANINAQSSSIYGKIIDKETKQELIYANIILSNNGFFAFGGSTNFEGNYSIPVDPGHYSIRISYNGYTDTIIEKTVIEINKAKRLDINLSKKTSSKEIVLKAYKVPLIKRENDNNSRKLTPEQIKTLPSKCGPVLSATTHISQSQKIRSNHITVEYGRTPRKDYFVNGVKVSGTLIPQKESIDSLDVMIPLEKLLGGTPAKKEN